MRPHILTMLLVILVLSNLIASEKLYLVQFVGVNCVVARIGTTRARPETIAFAREFSEHDVYDLTFSRDGELCYGFDARRPTDRFLSVEGSEDGTTLFCVGSLPGVQNNITHIRQLGYKSIIKFPLRRLQCDYELAYNFYRNYCEGELQLCG